MFDVQQILSILFPFVSYVYRCTKIVACNFRIYQEFWFQNKYDIHYEPEQR